MIDCYHVPIMFDEVMKLLSPERGGIFVDGTLGGGGHSTMAASQLKDCTLESAEAELKEAVDSYLQSR